MDSRSLMEIQLCFMIQQSVDINLTMMLFSLLILQTFVLLFLPWTEL